jgi:hypothetical protein
MITDTLNPDRNAKRVVPMNFWYRKSGIIFFHVNFR